MAKELERKRFRQRVVDKDYKKQKQKDIENSYSLYDREY